MSASTSSVAGMTFNHVLPDVPGLTPPGVSLGDQPTYCPIVVASSDEPAAGDDHSRLMAHPALGARGAVLVGRPDTRALPAAGIRGGAGRRAAGARSASPVTATTIGQ